MAAPSTSQHAVMSALPGMPGLPGVSRLILTASKDYPRYSEADVIELKDGRLLLAVARKKGADDFAPGTIIGLFSRDRGLTWDDSPHVIQDLWDDLTDLMSISFCRSDRGLHLFFLARGRDRQSDTRIYQMLSADEGKTWDKPQRVSQRDGYHIVNNARVIRTKTGRLIIPSAYVPGSIFKQFNQQRIFCLYSDDSGATWKQSNEIVLENKALMEPGVAQCADGSIYMTIRTALGHLYEARSRDNGTTWGEFKASPLESPAAPSTVFRDPLSSDLWMFWINRPKGGWRDRNPLDCAISHDHGRTWDKPRPIETDPRKSMGYVSVTVVKDHVLLTYYDWRNDGQPNFQNTHLRQRIIPRVWFRGEPVPPVFRTQSQPVLTQDKPWEGKVISMNSGLLAEKDRWRLWYTTGVLGPGGERLRVCYAESQDQGRTWQKPTRPDAPIPDTNVIFPLPGDPADCYHTSIHRSGDDLVAYVWRHNKDEENGLYRYLSEDDGRTFTLDPQRPLVVSPWLKSPQSDAAGPGRISNDAFDVLRNPNGSFEYFAACMVKADNPRTIVKHDNAAGYSRFIGRSTSPDGVRWSPVQLVITPQYASGDPYDQQFYGMQVFRYRRFYLGLLHTYWTDSQIIQPEWAWSHDGQNWVRTRTPCIPLGDEGSFDSRMILFGSVVVTADELVWLYSGYNWRHNAFRKGEVSSAIARATLPRRELDAWLETLPQP